MEFGPVGDGEPRGKPAKVLGHRAVTARGRTNRAMGSGLYQCRSHEADEAFGTHTVTETR
jgi:hypothetical protein